jgi:CRISPR/Cas system-associated exonuclease Cas4 (RecB family)
MKAKTLKRWSYSLWSTFQKCPRAVKYDKIEGIKQPPVPAMERGTKIHLLAEGFLKGEVRGMPYELRKLKAEYVALKKAEPEHIEEFMSLGRKFERVKDGFKDGWFTLKADAALAPRKGVAIGVDHKTGRYYPSHDQQAELTAIVLRQWYRDADGYEVEFFYVDEGEITPYLFTPKYLDKRVGYWLEEGEKMMREKKFLATPSPDACRWCGFRSDKGGPCQDWKRLKN